MTPKQIPTDVAEFVRRCGTDYRIGRYAEAGDYRNFLKRETARDDPRLFEYLQRSEAPGQPKMWADVDHIVPVSVWNIIMPAELGRNSPDCVHCKSNLFWRGPNENRSLDQRLIQTIKSDARLYERTSPAERNKWRSRNIEVFLRTKHDEALVFPGIFVDFSRVEDLANMGRESDSNWMGGHGRPDTGFKRQGSRESNDVGSSVVERATAYMQNARLLRAGSSVVVQPHRSYGWITGVMVAATDRDIAVATGGNRVVILDRAILNVRPEVGRDVCVQMMGGRGIVREMPTRER